jgi:hypothetical protein
MPDYNDDHQAIPHWYESVLIALLLIVVIPFFFIM